MKKAWIVFALIICLLFSGCGNSAAQPVSTALPTAEAPSPSEEESAKSTIYVFSMDTYMTITAYGPNRSAALQAAEDEVNRLNDLFSIGVADSEVATANRTGFSDLSVDTEEVIRRALDIYDMTDGAFDITVTPLMELWGFTTGNYHVPSDKELAETLKRTGNEKVQLDSEAMNVTLTDTCEIDLGGIAKGFTSARIMDIFAEHGVTSGIVSLGGNTQCLNLKPDGSKWRIGIRDPWGTELDYLAVIEVDNQCVITSGGYERFFTADENGNITTDGSGRTYIHILDPNTGIPIDNELCAVSIVSKDGTLADGLSTSLFIMGYEKSVEFWRENSELFDAIFILDDGRICATAGLEGSLTPHGENVNIEFVA